jgi:hypothetical protein
MYIYLLAARRPIRLTARSGTDGPAMARRRTTASTRPALPLDDDPWTPFHLVLLRVARDDLSFFCGQLRTSCSPYI